MILKSAVFLLAISFLVLVFRRPLPSPLVIENGDEELESATYLVGPTSNGTPAPVVTSLHYFVIDKESKSVLLQRDADTPMPPASTTKIMTALVALDHFSISQVINITREYSDGQVVGFKPGEQLTVEQLLYSLLVYSANDAAEILAENFPGGREAFVSAMNSRATDLGLYHTQFKNPSGLDEDGHYVSASDLARLADIAMGNQEFARIVGTENAVISNHVLTNINQLLGKVPGVLGIKTGYTDNAGQALVTFVNQQDHPIIIVVLKSTDRFNDTEKLINWVYSNFTWIPE